MSELIHFVTGKLAEPSLREVLQRLALECEFEFTIQVMPITVAALMTPEWMFKHLEVPPSASRVILPGYCQGNLECLEKLTAAEIERGPKDLRQLPRHFGQAVDRGGYGSHDIQIIAEINHASRLSIKQLVEIAGRYRESGADLIDVGCDPGGSFWPGVGDAVQSLCDQGYRVSIDSLNPREISLAVRAGAELVLSVNSTNRDAAVDWGCEVVVIPDQIHDIGSMDETIELLARNDVPMRLDPILEPIGLGFAESLQRYFSTRLRWPDAEMMMGIGNLTELTDVDSAGINVLLMAICQELGVRSVLTTEVINWSRTSVAECHLARQLVFHAVEKRVPAKHIDPRLVALRDPEILGRSTEFFGKLADQIRDNDLRIFQDGEKVHVVGKGIHLSAVDPFEIFDKLEQLNWKNLDASHSFYLGFEMCKALTANTLGKQYTQDEPLNWGMHTQAELERHRLSRRKASSPSDSSRDSGSKPETLPDP